MKKKFATDYKIKRRYRKTVTYNWLKRYQQACKLLDYVVEKIPKKNKQHHLELIRQVKDGKGNFFL